MATLILSAVQAAAATGGATAGFLAGPGGFLLSIGAAAIDSKLVYPTLFKQDPVEGQRLNGLDFQKTDEGAPANRLFGKLSRVAGTLIWMTPLREAEDREGSAKGGSGGEFVRFKYYADIAVEFQRMKRGKVVKRVVKVFADGKEFYNEAGLTTDTSTHISAEVVPVTLSIGSPTTVDTLRLISDHAAGGPNVAVYQSGKTITVSGFTASPSLTGTISVESTGATGLQNQIGKTQIRVEFNSASPTPVTGILYQGDNVTIGANTYTVKTTLRLTGSSTVPDIQNLEITTPLIVTVTDETAITHVNNATNDNGTWVVYASGNIGPTQSFVLMRPASTNTVIKYGAKDAGDTIVLNQEDSSFSKSQANDVRFYNGSRTQLPDAVVMSQETPRVGATNVPAFRGRAYMIVEDLELTDFGNRIPSFEFEVETEDDNTLTNSLSELILDSGLSENEFDLSGISSTEVLDGYAVRGVQSVKTALQPVMLAYHLVSQQDQGKIKLFSRADTQLIDITGKTVAFSPGESRPPRPAKYLEVGDAEASQVSVVKYYDPDNDLQIAKKQAVGSVKISDQTSEFNTNLTMTGDRAQRLANTLFEMSQIAGRRSVSFDLPPSYIDAIKESVRVRINKFGQDRQYLVTRVEEGANFILHCEAIEEDLEVFTQTALAENNQAL